MNVSIKIPQSELEKLRQKYIKINIDRKFTSLKIMSFLIAKLGNEPL
jgi:hypothetical protein